MSTQDPLFHEDFNDALSSLVKALGKLDAVAHDLWPTKVHGGRYLSDCLNPDRDAKLSLDDVVALLRMGRAKGIHWAMHKLCDVTGYAPPGIAKTKTPEQRLAEELRRIADDYARVADELAVLNQSKKLQAVS
jgi:hypothetical protein